MCGLAGYYKYKSGNVFIGIFDEQAKEPRDVPRPAATHASAASRGLTAGPQRQAPPPRARPGSRRDGRAAFVKCRGYRNGLVGASSGPALQPACMHGKVNTLPVMFAGGNTPALPVEANAKQNICTDWAVDFRQETSVPGEP